VHPHIHAARRPEKPAIILAGSREVITYRQLEDRSNQAAQLFRSVGLQIGDHVALLSENNARFLEICWAAQRSGLYYTCIPSGLTADEAEYIIRNCGAKVLLASAKVAATAALAPRLRDLTLFAIGGAVEGYTPYETAAGVMPAERIADERAGMDMLYSSGTTGRPKGVKVPPPVTEIDELGTGFRLFDFLGADETTVYLSPAPLYHAAPLRACMYMHRIGATSVVMERFDAEEALRLIERHCVTMSQWVPSMFVRLLKLPDDARRRYDLASHKVAIHAAAPCPIEVKHQMIAWWGPIIHEYYSGTEPVGMAYTDSEDWLAHPGTVGRILWGQVHILDEAGRDRPIGEEGQIYFSGGTPFEYHQDPEKTASSRTPQGFVSLGDIGKLDGDGFLYLTDRKAFVIISGGVNIYPQEVENLLISHPRVADVAVVGVPSEDFGEEVKAVVQPIRWAEAGPDLAAELLAYCRERLAKTKCPRSIDFDRELPRTPTGKLQKRVVRDRYWPERRHGAP
jgi:acyl-CoA synthetase (AMP-forming)/AMP-acid ligase II